jgi:2-oxoglutarate dehydrogenase E2 component (dihydrolipoamide succinyltransferase)
MGESIAEGTIVRWIKKVGDTVDRDEPLFEISTDKVDAEIPSPAAGVLTEIKAREGETVAVNSVVATIALNGEPASPPAEAPAADGSGSTESKRGAAHASASTQPQPDGAGETARSTRAGGANGSGSARSSKEPGQAAIEPPKDEPRPQKSSPLVRRIAREHNVDISRIHGSGIGGRVTKHDILGFLDGDQGSEIRDQQDTAPAVPGSVAAGTPRIPDPGSLIPDRASGTEIEPLSVMRRKIAEHMILSRRTSAHVHSVFHVNFSTVERIRQQKKAEYERVGAKLTYMAFIAKAVIDALRRHRVVNASLDGENIVYHKDINIGIAVALETGLIVPVIKHADEKNILGLTRAIADLADRSRSKQLKPDEVQDGTFTITNPGQFGAQFGMPIINQPQVAILGVGTIEKRPVVVDDAIAIRTMAYLTLGFDHRLVDGAVADQFMADVKNQLENFDVNQA